MIPNRAKLYAFLARKAYEAAALAAVEIKTTKGAARAKTTMRLLTQARRWRRASVRPTEDEINGARETWAHLRQAWGRTVNAVMWSSPPKGMDLSAPTSKEQGILERRNRRVEAAQRARDAAETVVRFLGESDEELPQAPCGARPL